MRILHLNTYYALAPFYKNLYDYQRDNGISLKVIVPLEKNKTPLTKDFGSYAKIEECFNSMDRINFLSKEKKIFKMVDKEDVEKYDVVHAHSLFVNGYIAMQLKKKYGIPYVVAVRNSDVNVFFKYRKLLRRTGINILEKADAIVFISKPYMEKVLKKNIPESKREKIYKKSIVITNGINDFWIKNKKVNSVKETIKVLTVGDIEQNKNQKKVLDACKKLNNMGFDTEYHIVGRKKDRKYFAKICEEEWVFYDGTKNQKELINDYRKNEIFVLPSFKETFGLVYAEAMSQGLPVIFSQGEGFDKQYEQGEVGYSVNPEDSDEIAERVLDIRNNYEQISKNCVDAVDRYSWESIGKKYTELYEQIK